MRRGVSSTVVSPARQLSLPGVTIIGLAVPGSLASGVSLACWAALRCGLPVRSLFVLSPSQCGRLGEVNRRMAPVPAVRFPLAGRGSRSHR